MNWYMTLRINQTQTYTMLKTDLIKEVSFESDFHRFQNTPQECFQFIKKKKKSDCE